MTSDPRRTLATLYALVDAGYLLHGSPALLTVVEPRQGRDGRNAAGNHLGVYASEIPTVAVLMAMFAPVPGHENDWTSFYSGTNRHMIAGGTHVTLMPGFVHVVRPEPFVRIDHELLSQVAVRVDHVLPVAPDIIRHMPNLQVDFPI